MWVKVRVGSRCRCKNSQCNAAFNRSAEVYLADDGTVLCITCYEKRTSSSESAVACIICNDEWARPDRLTCSRKCEYRLRKQNRRAAKAEEAIADAITT